MSAKKIVIVDDEPDVVMFLQAALEDNGYIALTASGAGEGLELIKQSMPDLVCLDVLMPKESGISLFRKLRTDSKLKEIPVIINSGLNFSRDIEPMEFLKLENGVVLDEPEGYIEKPVDVERLLYIVRKVLGK
ncbi:MAG: response regulator [Deltaproteobacteria bacterium]|nr:response regulator [Deltaproteobacteria bacterium]